VFFKDQPVKSWTTEQKMERFLTLLATGGGLASTQNQAFNALLFFYRDVLKQELGLWTRSALNGRAIPGNARARPST
jgi:hypothetical protein